MKSNDIYYKTLLFDFYGELLNERKKEIYTKYLNDDISQSELAEQERITRQGVFDTVSKTEDALINYENKLHLVQKYIDANNELDEIKKYINDSNSIEIQTKNILLERLNNISNLL